MLSGRVTDAEAGLCSKNGKESRVARTEKEAITNSGSAQRCH